MQLGIDVNLGVTNIVTLLIGVVAGWFLLRLRLRKARERAWSAVHQALTDRRKSPVFGQMLQKAGEGHHDARKDLRLVWDLIRSVVALIELLGGDVQSLRGLSNYQVFQYSLTMASPEET
jgi:hypothetical protein